MNFNGVRNGVIKLIIDVLHYRLWTNITWRFLLKSSKIYRRSRWQWKNIGETEINIIIVATINWKTLSSYLMRPKNTFLVAYRKVKRAPQYCSWQLWFGLNAILKNDSRTLNMHWFLTQSTYLCEEKNCHPKELIYDLCTNLYLHHIIFSGCES